MTTLDYVTPKNHFANPGATKAMVGIALACWLVPLACGLIALAGYWVSGHDSLVTLGLLSLMGGAVAAAVGLIVAILTYSFSARIEPETRSRLRSWASLSLVGIVLNFPIALGAAVIGVGLTERNWFEISNDGAVSLSNIVLELGNQRIELGDLRPGEKWTKWRSGNGPVHVEWVADGRAYRQSVDTYIDSGGVHLRFSLRGSDLVANQDVFRK